MEFTFFRLDEEESLMDQLDMLGISFRVAGVVWDVVQVHKDKPLDHISEDIVDEALVQ